MLKIWGRADGSNVIKAMWCIGELGIAHERIDWGGDFGGPDGENHRAPGHLKRRHPLQGMGRGTAFGSVLPGGFPDQVNIERVHKSSLDCVKLKILPRIEILVLLN